MRKILFFCFAVFVFFNTQAQSEDYSNKRVPAYFSQGNDIISFSVGRAFNNSGYNADLKFQTFFKDGISYGSNITGYLNNPEELWFDWGNSLRLYLLHSKIRPFIEGNLSFAVGGGDVNLLLYLGTDIGVSIAGITEMVGIDLMINYATPILNFISVNGDRFPNYFSPKIGIHFQW